MRWVLSVRGSRAERAESLRISSGHAGSSLHVRSCVCLCTGAPPTGAQAEEVTKQNVSLSWLPPLYNASLLYYVVEYRETRQNGYLYPRVATNSTFLSVSGFDEGTEHQFTVSGFFQGGVVGENISLLVTTQEDGEGAGDVHGQVWCGLGWLVHCGVLVPAAPSAAPVGVILSPRYSALVVTWQVCA